MFIHTLESLEEFEDYIKQLEETVGLSTETCQEVAKAISKERNKLRKTISHDDINSEFCKCKGTQDLRAMTGECRKCGKQCDY